MKREKTDGGLLLLLFLVLGAILAGTTLAAGESDPRPNLWAAYDEVLPDTLAKALPVDRANGYLTNEVKPGVYVVTDGMWQLAFATTERTSK